MRCRLCTHNEFETLVDLGYSPLSNGLLTDLNHGEMWFPLHAKTCTKCSLTQLEEFERPSEIFNADYPYFSSQSESFVLHAARLVDKIEHRFDPDSVIEIASNDGYLLQHFKEANVLGVEPSSACAEVAKEKGITTAVEFWTKRFGDQLAAEVDCIIGLNVLAHVPDLYDFIGGVKSALAPDGVAIFEFPYLGDLVRDLQFDTIYHEHFSYFSLGSASRAFAQHSMYIFDMEHLGAIHGGSLRIYVTHMTNHKYNNSCRGRSTIDTYMQMESTNSCWTSKTAMRGFKYRVQAYRDRVRRAVEDIKKDYCLIGYGAAAKGNTLLNYCGITAEDIDLIVDSTPAKQGKFAPGSHIPILAPEALDNYTPYDYVWILPWNWERQIQKKLRGHRNFLSREELLVRY